MNRPRHYCRNNERHPHPQRNPPTVLLGCACCDDLLRTTIAEMLEYAKKEYARGFRDGALAQDAHAEWMLRAQAAR